MVDIFLIIIYVISYSFYRGALSFVSKDISERFFLPPALIGGTFSFTYALLQPIVGFLLSIFPLGVILGVLSILSGIGALLIYFTQTKFFLFLGLGLIGLGGIGGGISILSVAHKYKKISFNLLSNGLKTIVFLLSIVCIKIFQINQSLWAFVIMGCINLLTAIPFFYLKTESIKVIMEGENRLKPSIFILICIFGFFTSCTFYTIQNNVYLGKEALSYMTNAWFLSSPILTLFSLIKIHPKFIINMGSICQLLCLVFYILAPKPIYTIGFAFGCAIHLLGNVLIASKISGKKLNLYLGIYNFFVMFGASCVFSTLFGLIIKNYIYYFLSIPIICGFICSLIILKIF